MRRPLFAMQRRGVQSVLCRGAVCNRIGQGILSAETSVSEIWKTARGSKEGVVHRCVLRMDARVICRRGDSVSMRSAVNPFWGRLKARRATSRAGLKSIRVLRPFRRLIDFAVSDRGCSAGCSIRGSTGTPFKPQRGEFGTGLHG